MKVVITSGYFNPLHIGHINLLREAKKLGDILIVIVNNDEQVKIKGSFAFMPQKERAEIIKAIRYVDDVFLSIDKDNSIAESLRAIAGQNTGELFFAKGGDRDDSNIPVSEKNICEKFNIKIINGVGGEKIQSSSRLISEVKSKNT